ncbi:hypothetical protein ABH917_000883 [Thermobifida halotolerans]|nr:hypothetical protein [Thermobifida halotolerans]
MTALRSIRATRPDSAPVHAIVDNLSPTRHPKIRAWTRRNKVELCFTPTHASWAKVVKAHFGALRQFTVANSYYPNHTVQTRRCTPACGGATPTTPTPWTCSQPSTANAPGEAARKASGGEGDRSIPRPDTQPGKHSRSTH